MCLSVFVQNRYVPYIDMVQKKLFKTGAGGYYGNKGGLCISFDLYNTSFFFINCHLAAFVPKFEKRNFDFYKLIKGLRSGFTDWEATFEYDYLFWFGDLNYRTDYKNFNKVVEEIERNNLDFLKEHDQFEKQTA